MSTLRSAYLWGMGLLFFVPFLALFLLISSIVPRPRYDPWMKAALRILFRLLHCRVRVEGLSNLRGGGPFLFMANHSSLFDLPLLQAYIPVCFYGVQAAEQFRWPLYGALLRRMRQIPIDRKNPRAAIKSLQRAEAYLCAGRSVAILPEGHRSIDGRLLPFKKMPFRLALSAGVPVVPVGLSGVYSLKSKNSWLLRPGVLKINFGRPIAPEALARCDIEQAQALVRARVLALIDDP